MKSKCCGEPARKYEWTCENCHRGCEVTAFEDYKPDTTIRVGTRISLEGVVTDRSGTDTWIDVKFDGCKRATVLDCCVIPFVKILSQPSTITKEEAEKRLNMKIV